jgi:chromosome segregation ATPase
MKSAGSPGAAPEDVGMMDDAAPGSPGMGGGDPYDAMAGAASEEDAASRLAQLQMQVEAQAQQLEVESKTNAELEDMLLRIEKHFKAEQVARRKAEEMVAEAESKIAAERAAKEAISAELNNVGHEAERNKALKAALSAEQGALESEKNKVMAEIEEARSDANRAADARLSTTPRWRASRRRSIVSRRSSRRARTRWATR